MFLREKNKIGINVKTFILVIVWCCKTFIKINQNLRTKQNLRTAKQNLRTTKQNLRYNQTKFKNNQTKFKNNQTKFKNN